MPPNIRQLLKTAGQVAGFSVACAIGAPILLYSNLYVFHTLDKHFPIKPDSK